MRTLSRSPSGFLLTSSLSGQTAVAVGTCGRAHHRLVAAGVSLLLRTNQVPRALPAALVVGLVLSLAAAPVYGCVYQRRGQGRRVPRAFDLECTFVLFAENKLVTPIVEDQTVAECFEAPFMPLSNRWTRSRAVCSGWDLRCSSMTRSRASWPSSSIRQSLRRSTEAEALGGSWSRNSCGSWAAGGCAQQFFSGTRSTGWSLIQPVFDVRSGGY